MNARHFKLNLRAPAAIETSQQALEARVRERCERGTLTVSVALERAAGRAPARIDGQVLGDYVEQLRGAARLSGLPADFDPAALVRLPGVLTDRGEEEETNEGDLALVVLALDAALDDLVAMREEEGAAAAATLGGLLDEIEQQTRRRGTAGADGDQRAPAADARTARRAARRRLPRARGTPRARGRGAGREDRHRRGAGAAREPRRADPPRPSRRASRAAGASSSSPRRWAGRPTRSAPSRRTRRSATQASRCACSWTG